MSPDIHGTCKSIANGTPFCLAQLGIANYPSQGQTDQEPRPRIHWTLVGVLEIGPCFPGITRHSSRRPNLAADFAADFVASYALDKRGPCCARTSYLVHPVTFVPYPFGSGRGVSYS